VSALSSRRFASRHVQASHRELLASMAKVEAAFEGSKVELQVTAFVEAHPACSVTFARVRLQFSRSVAHGLDTTSMFFLIGPLPAD
jgi:hypothetical protein